MALQSSGQITLDDIRTELGLSQSNVSLGDMSDDAGFSAPDQMSDFYGYSDTPTLVSFSSSKNPSTTTVSACSASVSWTYYHDGSAGLPQSGDTVYTSSAGTTTVSNGYRRTAFGYYYTLNGTITTNGPCL